MESYIKQVITPIAFYSCSSKKKENISLKRIEMYAELYKEYIIDNNLDDDSKVISIADLIFFVEEHIIPNDERYELI
jgi:hypothetical protein